MLAALLLVGAGSLHGEDLRLTWTGTGSDALASNPDNWADGVLPTNGNSVVFDDTSVADCTWDLDIVVSEWSQTADYEGTITFATKYPGQGAFTNLTIARDVDLQGGVWTHAANPDGEIEVNRLAVTVGGDFTLGAGAAVDLDGKGYAAGFGPGAGNSGKSADCHTASHGGAGERNLPASGTYGSITQPENLGSGGYRAGGGALRLVVAGTTSIDGRVLAQGVKSGTDSSDYSHGAGGSILIIGRAIEGSGELKAGVDLSQSAYYASGGGRIALISTHGEEFGNLALTANAHNRVRSGGGRAGTIYLETPTSKRLIIDQNNIGSVSDNYTDIPAQKVDDIPSYAFGGELEDVTLIATNGARVRVAHDLRIGGIERLEGTLSLNGRTLYVVADAPVGIFPNEYGNASITLPGIVHSFDNGDTLSRDGRLLWGDASVTWRAASVVYLGEGGTTAINDGANEAYFVNGTQLDFTAAPDTGYSFVHWDGTVEGAASSSENPLEIAAIESNLIFRAWFRDDSLDLSINTWLAVPANDDWFDPRNWSLYSIPVAGQEVVLPPGADVRLTNSTPALSGFTLAEGAILAFEGWDTALQADEMLIAGTVTHPAQNVTDPDPISGEWIPEHRVWLKGGNVVIAATGIIDVDSKGYPLNAGPGRPPSGLYAGAGHGGRGSGGFGGKRFGAAYGDPADPWQPGSGGGAFDTVRHGGGAVRIESTGRVVLDGLVTACGDDGGGTHVTTGSGGSVYISCDTFEGSASGLIAVDGGRGNYYSGSSAGGRIAIHYNPVSQSNVPFPRVRFSAYAWYYDTREAYDFPFKAEMGTLYLSDLQLLADDHQGDAVLDSHRLWYTRLHFGNEIASWAPQSLMISNCVVAFDEGFDLDITDDLVLLGDLAPFRGDSRTMRAGLYLYAAASEELYGAHLNVGGDLGIGTNAWIFPFTQGYSSSIVDMRVGGDVNIAAGGGIDAFEKGYHSVVDNSNGPGAGKGTSAGGAYGGYGGHATDSRDVYGSEVLPLDPGSPGGWYTWTGDHSSSGHGGGVIQLLVGGTVSLDGLLSASGGNGSYYRAGGGSGGSIFVACKHLKGAGEIDASGGEGVYDALRSGGGGRIAVWHGLPVVDVSTRIAALHRSEALASFTGEINVDPGRVEEQGNATAGTFGFYTLGGTLIILR